MKKMNQKISLVLSCVMVLGLLLSIFGQIPIYAEEDVYKEFITKDGHAIKLKKNGLYIDGEKIKMEWSYTDTFGSRRHQEVMPDDRNEFDKYIEIGTYKGPQSVTSNNCIRVLMKNFRYIYFYRQWGAGADYEFKKPWITNFEEFYIDIESKKVIDTSYNFYRRELRHRHTFTPFDK